VGTLGAPLAGSPRLKLPDRGVPSGPATTTPEKNKTRNPFEDFSF
jgi:hypothetical protein